MAASLRSAFLHSSLALFAVVAGERWSYRENQTGTKRMSPSRRESRASTKNTGPKEVLAIRAHSGRVRVELGGYLIAESSEALELREDGHSPVLYFPPSALQRGRVQGSEYSSHCPRKGQANYYSIAVGSCFEKDAIWQYQNPIASAQGIAGYVAFRPDAVDAFDDQGERLLGPAACVECED